MLKGQVGGMFSINCYRPTFEWVWWLKSKGSTEWYLGIPFIGLTFRWWHTC